MESIVIRFYLNALSSIDPAVDLFFHIVGVLLFHIVDLNACPVVLNLARALPLKMVQLYFVQPDIDDDDDNHDGVDADEPAGVTQPMRGSVVVKTVSSELTLVALAHHLQQHHSHHHHHHHHHHHPHHHQHHNHGHLIIPTVPIFPTTAQSL